MKKDVLDLKENFPFQRNSEIYVSIPEFNGGKEKTKNSTILG